MILLLRRWKRGRKMLVKRSQRGRAKRSQKGRVLLRKRGSLLDLKQRGLLLTHLVLALVSASLSEFSV